MDKQKKPHTRATRQNTDDVLAHLTQRIVLQSHGYRAIIGDFNQEDMEAIPQFQTWREHGFVEVQLWANQCSGREIEPTYHGKTVKDHIWMSAELGSRLTAVNLHNTVFPDHGVLTVNFLHLMKCNQSPSGESPLSCLGGDASPAEPPQVTSIPIIFQQLEEEMDCRKRWIVNSDVQGNQDSCASDLGLVKDMVCRSPVTPVKKSRRSEVQIEFLGEHFIHTKWCIGNLDASKVCGACSAINRIK